MSKLSVLPAITALLILIVLPLVASDVPDITGIKVEVVNQADIERLLSERQGKVLFLNVWATWCAPCREEFPEIVKLAKDYKESSVEIVALSIDFPEEIETVVIPFLKEHKVNFRVLVQDNLDPEKLINSLDGTWSGALPTTFIFDKQGSKQKTILGKRDYESFKKAINEVKTENR